MPLAGFAILKALPWKWIIGILAVLGLLASVYSKGYHAGDHRADVRIAAYEQQLTEKGAKIENGQLVLGQQIVTQYKDRVQKIYVGGQKTKELIKVVKEPSANLPAGWLYVYNLSVTGKDGDPKAAADATDSGVSSKQALAPIVDNNLVCTKEITKLEELQNWITQTQQNIQKSNGKTK